MAENTAPTPDTWASALGLSDQASSEEFQNMDSDGDTNVSYAGNNHPDTEESLLVGSDDTAADSEAKPEDAVKASVDKVAEKQKTSAGKEVITVTDELGRRRKVEIDFENRDAIKKAYEQAAGMRKFQAERDQTLQKAKQVEDRLAAREKDWGALEQAFSKGPEHLFDVLNGGQGSFRKFIDQEVQKARFLETASPDEIKALKAQESADLTRRELENIRRENADFKKQVSEEREAAEMRNVESRVNPTFEKYRFASKLGDEATEHMFDEMLWTSTLKKLEAYEEQGLELSRELVDSKFRETADAIRKQIGRQAEKKAGKVIEQKKQEATENVQAKIKSGYSRGGEAEDLKKHIQNNDTASIFKNWGSFKKHLSK